MGTTTLVKWGNGQGIRLTRALIEQAGLHVGDVLDVTVDQGRITITPAKPRVIGIPDYAALFADWQGPKPTEDGFANPVGRERM